jgi:hypothetical protein
VSASISLSRQGVGNKRRSVTKRIVASTLGSDWYL